MEIHRINRALIFGTLLLLSGCASDKADVETEASDDILLNQIGYPEEASKKE